MTNNISPGDGNSSPRDEFRTTFLEKRPKSQWPSYIDETAKDIESGIAIGDTGLDKLNFPREVGPLYRQGMTTAVGTYSDVPDILEDEIDDTELGKIAFLLNRLQYQIAHSDTGLENIQEAISAVFEKLLSETGEARIQPHLDQGANSTTELLIQLFSDPAIASQSREIVSEFEDAHHQGLLAKLDEPQMMTPLWEHQRDALAAWIDEDCRGFVDMATATGKTVLGLAALAYEHGSLHPLDQDIAVTSSTTTNGNAHILVVAHNDLILEQWRREFDRHLNIPTERTQGDDDVSLAWGTIHFRTAQSLMNQELINYDLVLLDEAHHYANGSGWGQILQEFDNDVLALSGSVDSDPETDSEIRDRLQDTIGPEVSHYTIEDGQADGVIPTFSWGVEYAPVEGVSDDFGEVTQQARELFEEFQEAISNGELSVPDERRLRTFEDVRQFSHTTRGSELKQSNSTFRELVTTLFSRRTQRWNLSPRLDTVVDVVNRYPGEKVVVLTDDNAQVREILGRLEDNAVFDADDIYSVHRDDDSAEQRDTVDAFDEPGSSGVLVGTGDLIGEGVDMQHASVVVNLATGGANKQLIQRIGRVLRNPDGGKEAVFVNIVGVQTDPQTQVPKEDGKRLIEAAHQFRLFGGRFQNQPWFDATNKTVSEQLTPLLKHGNEKITSLIEAGCYEWPRNEDEFEVLLDTINRQRCQSTAVLDALGRSPPEEHVDRGSEGRMGGLKIVVQDSEGAPVSGAFVSICMDSVTDYGRTDIEGAIRSNTITEGSKLEIGVQHPDLGITYVTKSVQDEDSIEETITLPPQPEPASGTGT